MHLLLLEAKVMKMSGRTLDWLGLPRRTSRPVRIGTEVTGLNR